MKINKITNAQEFFKVVDDCKGRVELLTGEGDRLNLKSKLCQFISMTQLFSKAMNCIWRLLQVRKKICRRFVSI